MPPLTTIICLANSRKHGARCIAGVEPATGAWIRPVSDLDDGRIERSIRLVNGMEPLLGDVLRIPLASSGPDFGFESENRSVLPGAWTSPEIAPLSDIVALKSTDPVVLHNDENYVTVEHLASLQPRQRTTLQLVEVTDLAVFSAGLSANGGRKWRASFTTGSGAGLACMITDPLFMDKLETGHRPSSHALLTVSLSMPYRPTDWEREETPCWKLIAGIIELTDREQPDSPRPADRPAVGPAAPLVRPSIGDEQMSEALASVFGFHSFRPGQEEIVRAIIDGRDVFAVMPTGGGKSLCYQLPACLLPGTCMVVSPLISLMKDQVDSARELGIRAAYVNSSQSEKERVEVLRALGGGHLDLIYISPERFALDPFLSLLGRVNLCLAAIDEAHCVSEWGHDFRPDYLHLAEVVKRFPHLPVAAFTATATDRVQQDIIARLGLRSPFLVRASFNRPNLFYEVDRKGDAAVQIVSFLSKRKGQAGIVYRMTRRSVEETHALLEANGIRSLPYHAGLDEKVRTANQEAFSRDEVDVIVATIAFGMGIDKSNVRYVLHGDLPKNLESYYQETGRAGRDGEPAHCLLLFSGGDIPRLRSFIDKVEDQHERGRLRHALDEMVSFATHAGCRRARLLGYFGERYPRDKCDSCDNCRRVTTSVAITAEARVVLAAIKSTGERFGAGHIIDIITGAKTKRVRESGHASLSAYGAGRGKTKIFWRGIVDDLIAQGVVMRSDGEYPVLMAGAGAEDLLRGARDVTALRPVDDKPLQAPAREEAQEGDADLFEHLRSLRRRLAEERNVPPYVVFSDRTLHEMAARVPLTEEELLDITGVGEVKLSQFGAPFLAAISEFARLNSARVAELRRSRPPAPAAPQLTIRKPPRTGVPETAEATWRLLQRNLGLAEIADARELTITTIVAHIEQLILAGRAVPIDRFVPQPRRSAIERLFNELGTEMLGPVVKASEGSFGYDEARLTRAWMKAGGEARDADGSGSSSRADSAM